MVFADLGAEVIKVEPPQGDPARRFGRIGKHSPLFVNCNRGKKSVCLDLKQPSDREELHTILAAADVVISNWRAEVAERLNLDDETLESRHPHLIRAYITGYGRSGPLAGAPAFDGVLQARLGVTTAQGGEQPAMIRSYFVDKVSALIAAQAVMAALLARHRTGQGQRIDVSMLDSGAYFNFPDVMMNRTFQETETSLPARNGQLDAMRPIRASNGWLVTSPVSGEQIRAGCAALGVPELVDELMAAENPTTTVVRMYEGFEQAIRDLSVDECVERLMGVGVPAGACYDLDEHLGDEQVAHNQLYHLQQTEQFGLVRQVRYPARFGSLGPLGSGADIPDLDGDGPAIRATSGGGSIALNLPVGQLMK
jgi:formyl-CoA transferase